MDNTHQKNTSITIFNEFNKNKNRKKLLEFRDLHQKSEIIRSCDNTFLIILEIKIFKMLRIANLAFQKQLLNKKSLTLAPLMNFSTRGFGFGPFDTRSRQTPFYTSENLQTKNTVAHNVGMKQFLTRTYNTTALSICGALGTAYLGMFMPAVMFNPLGTSLLAGLVMIGSFLGVNYIPPRVVSYNEPGIPAPIFKTENPPSRLALYCLGVGSLGLSASPLFLYMSAMNPSIITSSIGVTLGIFGGASAISYMLPKDQILGYGNIFFGSLLGLIGVQLVGIGGTLLYGPNALSTLLFDVNTYGGLLLFSGLIAYDTHVAIKSYEMGYADHLGISTQLLLDFWNLLVRVMEMMNRFKR